MYSSVYQHVLTLYYLAISRSNELYSTYNDFDRTLCKQERDFLICPEIYPLHPRSIRPISEVKGSLLGKSEDFPLKGEVCSKPHIHMCGYMYIYVYMCMYVYIYRYVFTIEMLFQIIIMTQSRLTTIIVDII